MDEEIIKLCKTNSFNTMYFEMGEIISKKYFALVSNFLNFNSVNSGISEETIYKNRLKLFKEFYEEHKTVIGPDAGVEQQIGNLIGEINTKFPNFDWNDIYH